MPTQNIGIVSLGHCLPERVFENAEWAQYVDTSDEWIRTRTGIERRRIATDGETTATLATAAARQAIERAGMTPEDLDEIIIATDTPEVFLPDTSCFVQEELGARNIPCFTMGGSGCAGFVQALDVGASRLLTGKDRVLIIGVELLSRIIDWTDRNVCVLFGDAAAAAVVGRKNV